jgi:hypothetical protein
MVNLPSQKFLSYSQAVRLIERESILAAYDQTFEADELQWLKCYRAGELQAMDFGVIIHAFSGVEAAEDFAYNHHNL